LKKDVDSNSAWGSLKAVKNDRYIILPKELYLYKPNDRYGEAYEGLAKILYPDVFN
jgi:iron complex transport system substrate-binding protein